MEQTLGKRIMANRKRIGLTQDQLAEKLGVTAQAVSKWENDQSCPDITMLPRLAEIFGMTTDDLLGVQTQKVHEAEPIHGDSADDDRRDGTRFDFSYKNGKKAAFGVAALVLLVGALLLAANLLDWSAGFWDILWPSALLILGLFGLYPKFSFFSLACTLCGGFFLLSNLKVVQADISGILLPVLLLLLGVSLLVDAIRKARKPKVTFSFDSGSDGAYNEANRGYRADDSSFRYQMRFSDDRVCVNVPVLQHGEIDVSFGDFTVDFSAVEALAESCCIDAHCSFGELILLVPSRFRVVRNDKSVAFADMSISGTPDESCAGTILLSGSVSFGNLQVRYI